jgi:circadian clock protein KaiC
MRLETFPTGVRALDQILPGGLLKGGAYILDGAPGTGKTVLASQMCFSHVASQGRALFVTLLAESQTRMLQHLRSMAFFDEEAMPDRLYLISGIQALTRNGLDGLLELIRLELRRFNPGLLVIDGFSNALESATTHQQFKAFVQRLQSHAAAAECTVLLLTSEPSSERDPAAAMVDGIIRLEHQRFGRRTERTLEIIKFRGGDFVGGAHPFRITDQGLVIYPRIEAIFSRPSVPDDYVLARTSTGVSGIDEMLSGGLLTATTTGLFGPTGIGKTTLGLQFISRSTAAEPGVFFTFFETPERLRTRAETMGLKLRQLEHRGDVEIIWRPQGEHILDELGHELIDAVRRRGTKRVFIDGYGGLAESVLDPERMTRYVSCLANEIRALGATTVVAIESRNILGASMDLPSKGLSSLLEGLILMRYAEVEGQIRRLISITKIRDSDFDPSLREFSINPAGIEVGRPVKGFEALLSGFGREPNAPALTASQDISGPNNNNENNSRRR